jgi:hypothetical protein
VGNAQAGWYDDGAGKKRWWDGEKWTDEVHEPQADAGGGLAGVVRKIEAEAVAAPNRVRLRRTQAMSFSRGA